MITLQQPAWRLWIEDDAGHIEESWVVEGTSKIGAQRMVRINNPDITGHIFTMPVGNKSVQ